VRSRKVVLGLAALALPALLAVVTAAGGHPWLPEACLAVLLLLVGALTLDTNKRARARYGARPVVTTTSRTPPSTTHEDLLGTIRLLQAQYVGRLDRAQDSLDAATAALLAASSDRARAGVRQP